MPIDLAAALALLALARRFTKDPLLPALAAVTSPAFVLGSSLYPDKTAFALGAWGLWFAVRGVDVGRAPARALGALMIGLGALTKYYAAVLIAPAAGYALARGERPKPAALWTGAALAVPALYVLLEKALSGAAAGAAWTVTEQSAAMPWWSLSHKARSLLAFAGGLAPAAAAAAVIFPPNRRRVLLALGAALAFLPVFDLAPLVRPVDRLTGALLAAAVVWAVDGIILRAPLFAPWMVGAAAGLFGLYWSIPARLAWFVAAPLTLAVFCAAKPRRGLWAAVGAQALLSLALALVDARHAGAQREFAAAAAQEAPGRRLWTAGHWGLQYYVERAGGKALDASRGGWEALGRGDAVVVPVVNSNVLKPRRRLAADVRVAQVTHPLPLRLISGYTGEAGFYSNVTGFLPWSISTEPVDELSLVLIK